LFQLILFLVRDLASLWLPFPRGCLSSSRLRLPSEWCEWPNGRQS